MSNGFISDKGTIIGSDNSGNAIGFEETVGTACKNPNGYTIGSYFKGSDGNFYEVTAAISSGATITVGTNCKKTDIATELSELNADIADLAYESETLEAGVSIKRLGKLRVLNIGGTFTVSTGSISINAITAADRPAQNILGEVGTAKLGGKYYPFSINLRTDGTVTGYGLDTTQTTGYIYLTGSPEIYATLIYAVK